mmetsp:Transcript_12753/g.37908  ORF Transcript_12753/g.37908 Transcript_12753/m.37908 type:complete len:224 (+) Transcript_12753:1656-2327(+)
MMSWASSWSLEPAEPSWTTRSSRSPPIACSILSSSCLMSCSCASTTSRSTDSNFSNLPTWPSWMPRRPSAYWRTRSLSSSSTRRSIAVSCSSRSWTSRRRALRSSLTSRPALSSASLRARPSSLTALSRASTRSTRRASTRSRCVRESCSSGMSSSSPFTARATSWRRATDSAWIASRACARACASSRPCARVLAFSKFSSCTRARFLWSSWLSISSRAHLSS